MLCNTEFLTNRFQRRPRWREGFGYGQKWEGNKAVFVVGVRHSWLQLRVEQHTSCLRWVFNPANTISASAELVFKLNFDCSDSSQLSTSLAGRMNSQPLAHWFSNETHCPFSVSLSARSPFCAASTFVVLLVLSCLCYSTGLFPPCFKSFRCSSLGSSRDLTNKNDSRDLCVDWVTFQIHMTTVPVRQMANIETHDVLLITDHDFWKIFFSEGRCDVHVNNNPKHVQSLSRALLWYWAALYTDASVWLVWRRTFLARRNNSAELMSSHFPIGNM